MEKTQTNRKELKFKEIMNAVATIKQVFAALMIAHELDASEQMTVLGLLNHDALKVLSKELDKPISEVYDIFKVSLEAMVSFEEKQQEKRTKKNKNNE